MTPSPSERLDQAWPEIRLYQMQQVIAEYLDVPLRIMRGSATDNLCARTPDRAEEFRRLLVGQPAPDPFRERLEPWVKDILTPNGNDFASSLHALKRAVWVTASSATNPFFRELQSLFPEFGSHLAVHLLRVATHLTGSQEVATIEIAPAFVMQIWRLPWSISANTIDNFLLVGPCWLLENLGTPKPFSSSSGLGFDLAVGDLIANLEDAFGRTLDVDEKSSLLVLSSSFTCPSIDYFNKKGEQAKNTIVQAQRLAGEDPNGKLLSISEWRRLAAWLLFWNSGHASVLARELSSNLDGLLSDQESTPATSRLSRTLSPASKTPCFAVELSLSAGGNVSDISEGHRISVISSEDQRLTLSIEPTSLRVRLATSYDRFLFEWEKFSEGGRLGRARQDYLSFDYLRHTLLQKSIEDIEQKLSYVVRRARRLVLADVAAFCRYDALADRLHCEELRSAPWLPQANRLDLDNWLAEVADNPVLRAKSAIFRCLDFRCAQSRLWVTQDSKPFGESLLNEVDLVHEDERLFGLETRDVLVVPVSYHERILGILYLAAGTPFRFSYADRNRLLNFVAAFAPELFEAYLMKTLQGMNSLLAEFLRADLGFDQENALCEGLIRSCGALLSLKGVALWWFEQGRERFELRGAVGKAVEGNLAESFPSLPIDYVTRLEPWSSEEAKPFFLEAEGLRAVTCVPISNLQAESLLAVLTLHDNYPIDLPAPLRAETRMLAQEVGQHLGQYRAQRERFEAIQRFIAHDIEGELKTIEASRSKLSGMVGDLKPESRERFRRSVDDIERHISTARELLDWMTNTSVQKEVQVTNANPITAYYHYLNRTPFQFQTNLRAVINGAVYPRTKELHARGIVIHQPTAIAPPLWVREKAVRQVFVNLIDNVVKYGCPRSPVTIDDTAEELQIKVTFEADGEPLRPELVGRPDVVFEPATRGVRAEVAKDKSGKGDGLYIARLLAYSWGGDIRLKYAHAVPWAHYRFEVIFPRFLSLEINPWSQGG